MVSDRERARRSGLKALTLALFAYVGTMFVVKVPWGEVLYGTIIPSLSFKADYVVAVVAVFGTTISPYLFFWQVSQEVEEQRAAKGEEPLNEAPEQARCNLQRIKIDTYVGMGFSNLIAFFIMLTVAVTCTCTVSRTLRILLRRRKRLAHWRANLRSCCSPRVSSVRDCLPCRLWLARPLTPSRRHSGGGSGSSS